MRNLIVQWGFCWTWGAVFVDDMGEIAANLAINV